MTEDEYTVRLIDMPVRAGGFITESPDGHLNIYINARHSREKQRKSFRHELRHAENDDLHSEEDIATIEARADGRAALRSIPRLMRACDLLPKTFIPDPPRKKLNLPPYVYCKRKHPSDPGDVYDSDFVAIYYHYDPYSDEYWYGIVGTE